MRRNFYLFHHIFSKEKNQTFDTIEMRFQLHENVTDKLFDRFKNAKFFFLNNEYFIRNFYNEILDFFKVKELKYSKKLNSIR